MMTRNYRKIKSDTPVMVKLLTGKKGRPRVMPVKPAKLIRGNSLLGPKGNVVVRRRGLPANFPASFPAEMFFFGDTGKPVDTRAFANLN
jgi:hypothetical protein